MVGLKSVEDGEEEAIACSESLWYRSKVGREEVLKQIGIMNRLDLDGNTGSVQ